MTHEIAILGGGIGGLSAAHELATRGFDVTVYEHHDRFGGKARSFPGPADGDTALPAEHGFRFLPGFYTHLPDTMQRIPTGDGSVHDHLVSSETVFQAFTTGDSREMAVSVPDSLAGWRDRLENMFGSKVPRDESVFFANKLLTLLSSCERRWDEEYEHVSWWEFIRAEEMSDAYQTFLGYGVTQSLVAMRPEVSSARTIGRIYLQLVRGLFDSDLHADRLLDGPTNDVFIDPWVAHLRDLGVTLHTGATVTDLEADGERVTGARVEMDDGERVVTADQYVLALPSDVVLVLLTPDLEAAAPSLAGVRELDRGWMNGIQFYLRRDVPTVRGHSVYYDSPWALTSISQRQFWDDHDFDAYDECEGVLSVIVSEWDEPGILYGKPARECTRAEVADEVWAQLQAHLNRGEAVLPDDVLLGSSLDPAIRWDDEAGELRNDAPLLVNTVGSHQYRPEAGTECPNLVLAADYVRTETDLASMECANEAARRAVNAILDRVGSTADRCALWEFEWPAVFEPGRQHDALNMRLGLPHPAAGSDQFWTAYRGVRTSPLLGRFFSE
ncbi:FAD-dependent oxidoreductase [Haloarchaeobius sp. HME9146]|uniref:hydroxysqualene dehydroxylase n=1 Tax=Haloarchaeobius sp. HME9146 TaxID=2978732 RepID=UPI0021C10B89|nr:FAD-dependent oxidoreductase [Haloarchaeobius sp. HME9146]MCT9096037.1 FAD-dependent oxidoreductase [Haloarchaeobius sp. HME9146]